MASNLFPSTDSTSKQAWALWLTTNALGLLCFVVTIFIVNPFEDDYQSTYWAIISVGCTAFVTSLPIVPVVFHIFKRLLSIPKRSIRILSTCFAVSAAFVTLPFILILITGRLALIALVFGAWIYWPAALLATAWVYRRPLFRPDAPASSDFDNKGQQF